MGILDTVEQLNNNTFSKEKEATPIPKSIRSRCQHKYVDYEKWIHDGPKQGVTFHYKERCFVCNRLRCVPRTQEIYNKVKDQPWKRKKRRK